MSKRSNDQQMQNQEYLAQSRQVRIEIHLISGKANRKRSKQTQRKHVDIQTNDQDIGRSTSREELLGSHDAPKIPLLLRSSRADLGQIREEGNIITGAKHIQIGLGG
jgi:hypothetical protein